MLNATIAILSVIVAVAAASVAWFQARRAERLSTLSTTSEWQRDVRGWAGEVIDVLASASYGCAFEADGVADHAQDLRACRVKLSALIDRGRFFFPNIPDPRVGKEKPAAYRGWRHGVLDPLVASERVLSGSEGCGRFRDREEALIAMRREFVSSIYTILGPEHYNQEIARLMREAHEARAGDKALGGLLPDGTTVPTGADRLLHG
jgi:hypothetical protein